MYTNFSGTALAVSGATQNSTISGGAGGDRTGTVRNDKFQSLNGDTLIGGLGDDTYILRDINSKVVEKAGEGIDTIDVRFWGGVTLSANVENVVLTSPGATWATGNALDNIMIAGTAGATLDGGKGQDVLVGGAGADVFKITKGNGSDVVMNFKAGWDVIDLSGYDLTFAQLKANATQVGSDVRFKLSSTEGLLLTGVQLSSLDAADFNIFTPVQAPTGYQTLSVAGQAMNYNGWYVLNNAWGAQHLASTDYTLTSSYNGADMTKNTTFNWAFDAKAHDLSILAYPEVAFGVSPFNSSGRNPTDTAQVFPIQVSEMVGLTAQYDLAYQGSLSGFNVSFDIWLANSATASGQNVITNEIMVWLHKGAFEAFGEKIGTYTDGAFSASIYHQGTYTAFVADKDWTTGTLDIARIINFLKDMSIVESSEYVRSIDFGAEVASGTGSLVIENLDLRVETKGPDGGIIVKTVDGSGASTAVQTETPRPVPGASVPDSAAVKSAFADEYVAGRVVTYDAFSAVSGSLKTTLTTANSARLEQYDATGKFIGVTVVTTEKGNTIVEARYDAVDKLLGAVKTIYGTDGSVQTVNFNANWVVKNSQITSIDATGASITKLFGGEWTLTGIEKVTTAANVLTTQKFDASGTILSTEKVITNTDGSVKTEHYDAATKLTGSEVETVTKNVTKTVSYDAKGALIETHTVTQMGDGTSKDLHHNAAGKIVDIEYYGTAKNDDIVGSAYTNHFHGGAGSDRLTAGKGKDFFHFDTALSGGGADTIVDFSKANDKIVLHGDVFAGLGAVGQLSASAFVIGTAATDANDRIIYNAANGKLFYDADGNGAGAAVQIATIHSDAALALSNFIVM